MGGYSNKKYFSFLIVDFDNKSIRYSDLIYRQFYYSVKITGGVRLNNKKIDARAKVKVKRLDFFKLP
jgi:hypothetical protein